MFKVEDKEKIGAYLEELIVSKYKKKADFSRAVIKYYNEEITPQNVKSYNNRISQILSGKNEIQSHYLLAFSKLLQISPESILTAGNYNTEISTRTTNYDAALSDDSRYWDEHIKNCGDAVLNPDEYCKNLLEYAFENRNYKLLKYLCDKGMISFDESIYHEQEIPDDVFGDMTSDFGLKTPFLDVLEPDGMNYSSCWGDETTSHLNSYSEWRNQLIALAVKNDDIDMLKSIRAREFSFMYGLQIGVDFDSDKYYSEQIIRNIADTNNGEILEYFLEPFIVETDRGENRINCNYLYIGKIVDIIIKNKPKKAESILKKILAHNEYARDRIYEHIDQTYHLGKWHNDSAYLKAECLSRSIRCENKDTGLMECNLWGLTDKDAKSCFVYNVIEIKETSKNEEIKKLIEKINEIFNELTAGFTRAEILTIAGENPELANI